MTSTSGCAGEGAGDEHPPLLAAGQGADVGVGPVGEPDDVEALADDRRGRRRRQAGRHHRRCGSRPTATISSTVARTEADRVCRCGT